MREWASRRPMRVPQSGWTDGAKDRPSIRVPLGVVRQRQMGGSIGQSLLERPCCTRCSLDMARILIIDTQSALRHSLVSLLEQAGHNATAVATIAEAASILAVDVPDLLATDVVLIDGSSTSLAKQAEAAGAKTLMMTGSPDRIIEFDGFGQPYLSKPFPPEAFLQRVEQILSTG
jgi:CheY-like chemotaxis protein